jgi:predicted XRE-type DNA-binding protein
MHGLSRAHDARVTVLRQIDRSMNPSSTVGRSDSGDVRLPLAEERVANAALVRAIANAMNERQLTQREAADLMGIEQPRVSNMLRRRLHFTTDRLLTFLTLLGCDVEIVVRRAVGVRKRGRLSVSSDS